MKQSNTQKVFLIIAGLLGIYVGSGLLFYPVSFEASAGIEIKDNVGLLSEIRGIGGTLLVAGFIIISGAFKKALTSYSLLLTVIIYSAYGFSRIYAMMADGLPSITIQYVAIVEIFVGLLAAGFFYKFNKPKL